MKHVPSGQIAAQPFFTQLAQGNTREHLGVTYDQAEGGGLRVYVSVC